MKRAIIATIILIAAALGAQAATSAQAAGSEKKPAHSHVRKAASARAAGAVTYNRDSRDPDVGWHWENGMRTCHQDCDNPEIPGSGYTCRNVTWLGISARECDWSSE